MLSDEFEGVEALSRVERAERLLGAAENQWFDRKSSRVSPRDLAEDLVGFANAEGGLIAVGLHSGEVDGLFDDKRDNALRQAGLDFTVPPVRASFSRLAVSDSAGRDADVLLVRIPPGEFVHETVKGECFLRVGDETRKLTFAQRQELHYDRGAAQFEATPADGVSVADLDAGHAAELGRSIGLAPDAGVERVLHARNLLTRRGSVSVAAYLLLGEHPQDLFPQSHVRVMRYLDSYRGSGREQTLDAGKDRRVEGPIPDVIDGARELIRAWAPARRALTDSGRFEPVPLIPEDAWLEGLVNAVVHRSYSLAGDHIRIEIFPDRIEIHSPGRFPGLADPRRPLEISRYARNPRIARVCHDLGITQERGEGIRRIFDRMRGEGLVDPQYEQTSGSVRLSLVAAQRLDADVLGRLPVGATDVLRALRDAGRPLGTGELMGVLGRSRPWVREALEALRAEGQVSWSGTSVKDPRATWSLA